MWGWDKIVSWKKNIMDDVPEPVNKGAKTFWCDVNIGCCRPRSSALFPESRYLYMGHLLIIKINSCWELIVFDHIIIIIILRTRIQGENQHRKMHRNRSINYCCNFSTFGCSPSCIYIYITYIILRCSRKHELNNNIIHYITLGSIISYRTLMNSSISGF